MIDILYRDDSLLVIDKPPGLLTHRSELAGDRDVAMTRARDAIGRHVFPLHRLDRQTSGVLAFALSAEAARRFRELFDGGRVEKSYIALVRGQAPESVHVDYPIPAGEDKPRVDAITDIRRLYVGSYFSVVEARPRTGRFHQVRRHLKHLRHPIALDSHYGTGWFNRKVREEAGLERLALHAHSLVLPVPEGLRQIVAPLPADLRMAFERLGIPHPSIDALELDAGHRHGKC